MSLWKVGIWMVSTLGVAGTIALFAVYPAIMGSIWRGIINLFGLVLSYRIGCAIVAAVIVGFAVDYARHSHDDKVFAERVAAFEEAQRQRDKTIEADTKLWVTKQIADDFMAEQDGKQDVDSFTKDLPVSNVFRVGDAAPKLRALAGLPVSKHHQRVQAPPRARTAARH